MHNVRFPTLLAVLAATAALAGCFGGGDDATAMTPAPADPLASVPADASQSLAGTIDYQRALTAQPSETREPIDVSAVTLPTSDTSEPATVN